MYTERAFSCEKCGGQQGKQTKHCHRQDYTQHLVQLLRLTQLEAHSVRLLTCHPQPIVDGVRFHVVCRDSTGSHLFLKPLRYRLGCHLIATLVKRLWLSYLHGLHIPATRWIWKK